MSISSAALQIPCARRALFPYDTAGSPRMPGDYTECVNPRGDQFRDGLTRACLYVASSFDMSEADSVVMCGKTPNIEALENFYASCRATPTAQGFAVATTSAGTTSLNIARGVRGGNLTVSVGNRATCTAMMLAKIYIHTRPGTAVYLVLPQDVDQGLQVAVLEVRCAIDGRWLMPALKDFDTNNHSDTPQTFVDEPAFLDELDSRLSALAPFVLGT